MLNSISLLSFQSTAISASSSHLNPYKTHLSLFPTTHCSVNPLFVALFGTVSFPSSFHHHLSFRALNVSPERTGFRVCAMKKRRKGGGEGGGTGVMELKDSDDEDYHDFDNDDEDDFDDEDGDEEDEGLPLPLRKMNWWIQNKPRGFGEGKEYDTSIEDKLFDEMEQSRLAQAANLNKLKNDSLNRPLEKKASEAVMSGVRVRVINLPRKKNIHRDLKSAFQGVQGILNINPAVTGNKKTRDPVCKGFAFVHFKSEQDATRFMRTFSGETLTFGKIQKQIKCELVNPQSPSISTLDHSTAKPSTSQLAIIPEVEIEQDSDTYINDSSLEQWDDETSFEDFDEDDPNEEFIETVVEKIREDPELESESMTQSSSSPKDLETVHAIERIRALEKRLLARGKNEEVAQEKPGKQKTENAPRKKPVAREKGEKTKKLAIPGSAKRLKVKEKAMLADVFSRYGAKPSLASKQGN